MLTVKMWAYVVIVTLGAFGVGFMVYQMTNGFLGLAVVMTFLWLSINVALVPDTPDTAD